MNRRQRRTARRLANGTASPLVVQLQALGPCPDYGPDCHTIEAAAIVARARVAWQQARAAILAAHRKRMRVSDPELLQAPTVEISVDDPDGKQRARRNVTRVRQSDAWRYNVLTAMQHQAETEMLAVWKVRTAGLGVAASNLEAIRAGSTVNGSTITDGQDHRLAELESAWAELVRECRRWRIPLRVVLDVLAEPRTLGEIERQHRLRSGAALFEYCRALDLWAEVRGWLRSTLR